MWSIGIASRGSSHVGHVPSAAACTADAASRHDPRRPPSKLSTDPLKSPDTMTSAPRPHCSPIHRRSVRQPARPPGSTGCGACTATIVGIDGPDTVIVFTGSTPGRIDAPEARSARTSTATCAPCRRMNSRTGRPCSPIERATAAAARRSPASGSTTTSARADSAARATPCGPTSPPLVFHSNTRSESPAPLTAPTSHPRAPRTAVLATATTSTTTPTDAATSRTRRTTTATSSSERPTAASPTVTRERAGSTAASTGARPIPSHGAVTKATPTSRVATTTVVRTAAARRDTPGSSRTDPLVRRRTATTR